PIEQTRRSAARAAAQFGADLGDVTRYIASVYPVETNADNKRVATPVGVLPDAATAPTGGRTDAEILQGQKGVAFGGPVPGTTTQDVVPPLSSRDIMLPRDPFAGASKGGGVPELSAKSPDADIAAFLALNGKV